MIIDKYDQEFHGDIMDPIDAVHYTKIILDKKDGRTAVALIIGADSDIEAMVPIPAGVDGIEPKYILYKMAHMGAKRFLLVVRNSYKDTVNLLAYQDINIGCSMLGMELIDLIDYEPLSGDSYIKSYATGKTYDRKTAKSII